MSENKGKLASAIVELSFKTDKHSLKHSVKEAEGFFGSLGERALESFNESMPTVVTKFTHTTHGILTEGFKKASEKGILRGIGSVVKAGGVAALGYTLAHSLTTVLGGELKKQFEQVQEAGENLKATLQNAGAYYASIIDVQAAQGLAAKHNVDSQQLNMMTTHFQASQFEKNGITSKYHKYNSMYLNMLQFLTDLRDSGKSQEEIDKIIQHIFGERSSGYARQLIADKKEDLVKGYNDEVVGNVEDWRADMIAVKRKELKEAKGNPKETEELNKEIKELQEASVADITERADKVVKNAVRIQTEVAVDFMKKQTRRDAIGMAEGNKDDKLEEIEKQTNNLLTLKHQHAIGEVSNVSPEAVEANIEAQKAEMAIEGSASRVYNTILSGITHPGKSLHESGIWWKGFFEVLFGIRNDVDFKQDLEEDNKKHSQTLVHTDVKVNVTNSKVTSNTQQVTDSKK